MSDEVSVSTICVSRYRWERDGRDGMAHGLSKLNAKDMIAQGSCERNGRDGKAHGSPSSFCTNSLKKGPVLAFTAPIHSSSSRPCTHGSSYQMANSSRTPIGRPVYACTACGDDSMRVCLIDHPRLRVGICWPCKLRLDEVVYTKVRNSLLLVSY